MPVRQICFTGMVLGWSVVAQAGNMAYVEVNSQRVDNARCYIDTETKAPFFSMASVFAANINGKNPNSPELFLNDKVLATLQSSQVQALQQSGIKVLVTILGNHQNAGWSCMTDPDAAKRFADQVANFVEQYHLDGIDIDDEYSNCAPNKTSLVMMAKAIKEHPRFQGKLLTKALYNDSFYFMTSYQGHNLNEYLDYGFEMSYYTADFWGRLDPYIQVGIPISKLMIGASTNLSYPDPFEVGKFTQRNATAGVMVYNLKNNSLPYLNRIQKGLTNNKSGIEALTDCLSA